MKKTQLLKKNSDGTSYLPWFKELKKSLAWHSAASVQEFGTAVLGDLSEWQNQYKINYEMADDIEKREMSREKYQRKSASVPELLYAHCLRFQDRHA